jgi:hypothetical protein
VRYVIDTGKSKEKRYLAGHTGGGRSCIHSLKRWLMFLKASTRS